MEGKTNKEQEKVPKSFEDIKEAIIYTKNLADKIRVNNNRTVVIEVRGDPYSGKTFFIKSFVNEFTELKSQMQDGTNIYSVHTTNNYDNPDEWQKAKMSDYFLVHFPLAESKLTNDINRLGEYVDIVVYIYNPKHSDKNIPTDADIVIKNKEAKPKN